MAFGPTLMSDLIVIRILIAEYFWNAPDSHQVTTFSHSLYSLSMGLLSIHESLPDLTFSIDSAAGSV